MDKYMPHVLEEYLEYINGYGKIGPKTAKAYSYDIVLFLKHVQTRFITNQDASISLSEVDINLLSKVSIIDIIAFMNYLTNNRNNGEAAKARKLSSLHSFFYYLVNVKKYLKHNPCDDLVVPKQMSKIPQQLKEKDALLLVNDIGGKYPYRDKAIILLFVYTGLRLHELVNIKLEDLDLENHKLLLKQENHEDKIVILNDKCQQAIYEYLHRERKNASCNTLFLSQRQKQISSRTIQHLIKIHRDNNPDIQHKISSQKLRFSIRT